MEQVVKFIPLPYTYLYLYLYLYLDLYLYLFLYLYLYLALDPARNQINPICRSCDFDKRVLRV